MQLSQAVSPGIKPAEVRFEPVAGPSTTQPGFKPVAGPSTSQPGFKPVAGHSRTQLSFADVLNRPRTAPVVSRDREALDAHFHVKMPEAGVTLRKYLDYPMPHHQSYSVTLRARGGRSGCVLLATVLP